MKKKNLLKLALKSLLQSEIKFGELISTES